MEKEIMKTMEDFKSIKPNATIEDYNKYQISFYISQISDDINGLSLIIKTVLAIILLLFIIIKNSDSEIYIFYNFCILAILFILVYVVAFSKSIVKNLLQIQKLLN